MTCALAFLVLIFSSEAEPRILNALPSTVILSGICRAREARDKWSRRIPPLFSAVEGQSAMLTEQLERTPSGCTCNRGAIGILRLRECFASRSTHFAQDDKLGVFLGSLAGFPSASSSGFGFLVLVFLVLVFLALVFPSEAGGCNARWENRFPSASSGQALTGRTVLRNDIDFCFSFGNGGCQRPERGYRFRNLDEESEMTLRE
jgi:hypothetical protein